MSLQNLKSEEKEICKHLSIFIPRACRNKRPQTKVLKVKACGNVNCVSAQVQKTQVFSYRRRRQTKLEWIRLVEAQRDPDGLRKKKRRCISLYIVKLHPRGNMFRAMSMQCHATCNIKPCQTRTRPMFKLEVGNPDWVVSSWGFPHQGSRVSGDGKPSRLQTPKGGPA